MVSKLDAKVIGKHKNLNEEKRGNEPKLNIKYMISNANTALTFLAVPNDKQNLQGKTMSNTCA